MVVRPVPDGYHTVTPYLTVQGAAELIEFLKQAFDARELHRTAAPDGKIMHASLAIGDSPVMLSDARDQWQPMPAMIHLYVDDADAMYDRAVKAGATSIMAVADQFYGDRSGGVKDRWGNTWWVATHKEDVPPEEMEKRAKAAMALATAAPQP